MTDTTAPARPADITLTGAFAPLEARQYRHVPFEVPAGTVQLHFAIDYNDQIGSSVFLTGGNTLDIGVFDERGTVSGGPGFRGWSGSNKLSITLGEAWATPPYRPGPLGAGRWHLLLGPYKIGPDGLNYRVSIWRNPEIAPPPATSLAVEEKRRAPLPAPLEPGWIRGDLHTHSVASDGDSTLHEVLAAAAAVGLDFVGSTDHNAAILPVEPDAGCSSPVLIPGIEVTTYQGHWNVWGANRWFDFRLPDGDAVAKEMTAAAEAGGFISINHPKPFGPPWEYGFGLGYHGIEVWNGPWPALNATSLGVWDVHLALGQRVVATAGSDTHFLKGEHTGALPRARLGEPTLWVKPENPLSAESILAEVRAGRSFMSAGPEGPQLLMDRTNSDRMRVRTAWASGKTLALITSGRTFAASAVDRDQWEGEFRIPEGARHVRAQLMDGCGNVEALTNALWLD